MGQNPNSAAAFAAVKHATPSMRQIVLGLIDERGSYGATDDEVEFVTGMKHQTASARRRELVLKGDVRDSGRRRNTRSGCAATVWILA